MVAARRMSHPLRGPKRPPVKVNGPSPTHGVKSSRGRKTRGSIGTAGNPAQPRKFTAAENAAAKAAGPLKMYRSSLTEAVKNRQTSMAPRASARAREVASPNARFNRISGVTVKREGVTSGPTPGMRNGAVYKKTGAKAAPLQRKPSGGSRVAAGFPGSRTSPPTKSSIRNAKLGQYPRDRRELPNDLRYPSGRVFTGGVEAISNALYTGKATMPFGKFNPKAKLDTSQIRDLRPGHAGSQPNLNPTRFAGMSRRAPAAPQGQTMYKRAQTLSSRVSAASRKRGGRSIL